MSNTTNVTSMEVEYRPDRPLVEIWRMFFANKAAVFGLVLWTLIIFTAFLGPVIYSTDPFDLVGAPMEPPGEEFLLGTDYLGRDILAGIIHGASVTLAISKRPGSNSVDVAKEVRQRIADMQGKCDSLSFLDRDSVFHLTGEPKKHFPQMRP